jgi:two-component system NarL family sensor kinase
MRSAHSLIRNGRRFYRASWVRGLLLLMLASGPPAAATALGVPTDTIRVKDALRQSAALAATDTARAQQLAQQALALSTAAGYGYGQAHGWLQLSALALIRGDQLRAQRYGVRAQAVAQPLYRHQPSARLARLLAGIANNLGSAADHRGQYSEAVAHYLEAIAYLMRYPDQAVTLRTVYANLGNCLLALGQPDRAAGYWRRAVALRPRTEPPPELLPVYLQLAALHLQNTHFDSARQALAAARPLVHPGSLYAGEYYGTLGQYYLQRQQATAARQAFAQALGYATRKGAAGYQAQVLLGLGQLDQQAGDLSQARTRLLQSVALTEQRGDPQQLATVLQALAQVEEQAGQGLAALQYYRRSRQLLDTLAGAATRRQINQLETRFRTREQAQQLRVLRQAQATQQQALRQQRQLSALYLALLLTVLGAGALGLALWRHRRRLAAQQQAQVQTQHAAQAMLHGQETERRRLARDLHDSLGGMLATVRLYLASAGQRPDLPAEPAHLLTQAVAHLDSTIGELRQVARNLMPEALLTFGLSQALHDLAAARPLAERPQVQVQLYGLDERLAPALEVELYRLVQELLANAHRHAHAQQVLVQLMCHGPELQLVVEDDGCGFNPDAPRAGMGLRSVQARVQYLGGTLEVQSRPGHGTTVSIELQVPPLAGAG